MGLEKQSLFGRISSSEKGSFQSSVCHVTVLPDIQPGKPKRRNGVTYKYRALLRKLEMFEFVSSCDPYASYRLS